MIYMFLPVFLAVLDDIDVLPTFFAACITIDRAV